MAETYTFAEQIIVPVINNTVASPFSGALVTVPATVAGTCAAEALTCAAPAVSYTAAFAETFGLNTLGVAMPAVSSSLPSLALVPAATNTGVCLVTEVGVCAAELAASGVIFTSLLSPIAIAAGVGGLVALGAAAYSMYQHYQVSGVEYLVATSPKSAVVDTPVVVGCVSTPDADTKKPSDDIGTMCPAIVDLCISPAKDETAGDTVQPKVVNIAPWKLGVYTGLAVTVIVGGTLAVYFVAPFVAPVIMTNVAAAQAAVLNFALQHTSLMPVVNALGTLAACSGQLAVPVINILANFTNLLGNIVTINSATNAAIGVKSLMLTAGSGTFGAAVGCAAAPVVSAAATKVANKFEM